MGSLRLSVRTRLGYFFIFVVSTLCMWLFRDEAYKWIYSDVPEIKNECDETSDCAGYSGVLRFGLANMLFFGLLCLITIGVENSDNSRASLHNDMYICKWLLWFGIVIGMFAIPNSSIDDFARVGRYLSIFFIAAQGLALIDFARAWNHSWVARASEEGAYGEDSSATGWHVAILTASAVLYGLSITVLVYLYIWFGGCEVNEMIITITLILCLGTTVLSLLEFVDGGFLPAGVLTAYATYLCWAAMLSQPGTENEECNELDAGAEAPEWLVAIGLLITLWSLGYVCLKCSGENDVFSIPPPDDDDHSLHVVDDEEFAVAFDYSLFHAIFTFASPYVALLLTHFHTTNSSGADADADFGGTSMWVRIVGQWAVFLLYVWTLLAPVAMPDRDFSGGLGFHPLNV
eukprot:Rmarinus@m.21816